MHGAEEVLHDADSEDHRRVHHGGGARQGERHPAAPQPRLDRENKVTGDCDFVTLERVKTAELDIYLMRLMQLNRKHPFSKLFSSVWPTAICGGELSSHYRVLQIWHRCCDEYTPFGHDMTDSLSLVIKNLASQRRSLLTSVPICVQYQCPSWITLALLWLSQNNYVSK